MLFDLFVNGNQRVVSNQNFAIILLQKSFFYRNTIIPCMRKEFTHTTFPKKSDCIESLLKKVPMGAVSTCVSIAGTARKPMSARPAFAVEDPAVTARTAINTVLILSRKCVQNSPSRPMSAPTAKIGRDVLCESMSISRILQTSPIGRRSSRAGKGLAIDPLKLERIDKVVSPLIKNGQSIHHVFMSNADELMVSEKTAYNYLNAGLFDADKMDCPRIIRMRPRRSTPRLKIDRHCYEGRTCEDFMRFIADNPDVPVVQMDSVIGNKSGKVLLTMFFQNSKLNIHEIEPNDIVLSPKLLKK